MAFTVRFTPASQQELEQLDPVTGSLILGWLNRNLENCYNPRVYGYQLEKYNYSCWKYTLGDYRLLSAIEKDDIVILSVRNRHNERD
ncbi:MAG: type II toxin-antitoxin system RelE/ParE family toxin [Erysipelotrichaceae bacterium]|nr:type II toxin-antitoxin system RelE/ParE family toxin [Erysipelotrichaceae bacterium]MBR5048786.1 type II toxin-antitoxin system RelE/ParE family toxin [Erysipelotrichaceae bacterium]